MSIWNTMSLFAKSNSTSILTGFAITGVVTTGIFAGKASIKAEKILENIKSANSDPDRITEIEKEITEINKINGSKIKKEF